MNFWFKLLILISIFIILLVILVINYTDGYRYATLNYNDIYELDKEYQYKEKIKDCVITLTTTPDRISKLKPNLISLLDSSVAVEEIRINVPYKSCKGVKYKIPSWLKKLKSVKIYRTLKDWGPATKLLPTLLDKTYKKIIVVDDDVIYGYYMVENINKYFEKYNQGEKKTAITMYGDRIGRDNHMKYDLITRTKNYVFGECYTDVLRGHSAYMVSSDMFTEKIFEYEKVPKECFFVDDNYFSFHLKSNKVKILMVGLTYKSIPLPDMVNCFNGGLHPNENHDGRNEVKVNRFFNK
jgi:hypothetical protein